jgi:hypothetical protein
MKNLFKWRPETKLHSGGVSDYKIECDALTTSDWYALAHIIKARLPGFRSVEGVPRGGLQLQEFLVPFATGDELDPLLIVDDVLTSGRSMEDHRAGRCAIGAVVFARGPAPEWVYALFTLNESRHA